MKKLLSAICLCLVAALQANAQNDIVYNDVPISYKTYCNEKFQFCVKYPDAFTSEGENEAGNGQTFEGADGTVLETEAAENTENLTVKKAYSNDLQQYSQPGKDVPAVVIDVLEKDRYVLITKDEIELVAKLAVLKDNVWKTVTISIPKKRETYYKDKIDEIFRTFNAHSSTGLSNTQNTAKK